MIHRETNSLLRLFGTPRELLSKADADLARLTEALARGRQREALHALMDCAITVSHTGDWIRATQTEHRRASIDLAASSKWLRMTRDTANAAKHGDRTWKPADAEIHGNVLATMEYKVDRSNPATGHRIVAWLVMAFGQARTAPRSGTVLTGGARAVQLTVWLNVSFGGFRSVWAITQ